MKLFFDGACRPNPGAIRTAVVAGGRAFLRDDPGKGDCNDAEWLALLDALAVARDLGLAEVILLGDSALVVNQALGRAPCRAGRFAARLARFRELAKGFRTVRVRRIARTQNLAGIALERSYGRL